MQVKSAFTIDKKDVHPAEWQGGQMTHTRFYKTFTGEIVGSSIVEAIMMTPESDGPAVYVGIERFECTILGRKGTFLLMHAATHHASGGSASWQIVAGSGTGELAGIRGEGQILPNHELALSYELHPSWNSELRTQNSELRTQNPEP